MKSHLTYFNSGCIRRTYVGCPNPAAPHQTPSCPYQHSQSYLHLYRGQHSILLFTPVQTSCFHAIENRHPHKERSLIISFVQLCCIYLFSSFFFGFFPLFLFHPFFFSFLPFSFFFYFLFFVLISFFLILFALLSLSFIFFLIISLLFL